MLMDSTDEPIAPIELTNSLNDLLMVGKRSMSEDPYALKSKDRLFLINIVHISMVYLLQILL